jgi:hypothetical protein
MQPSHAVSASPIFAGWGLVQVGSSPAHPLAPPPPCLPRSEMFSVNHFIVSQTNPHVVPFLNLKRRLGTAGAVAESEFKHRQAPAGGSAAGGGAYPAAPLANLRRPSGASPAHRHSRSLRELLAEPKRLPLAVPAGAASWWRCCRPGPPPSGCGCSASSGRAT